MFVIPNDFIQKMIVLQAVLSVWWWIEDTGSVWDDGLACAELLAAIKV